MFITYEIEYDSKNKTHFMPLSEQDTLFIQAPFWLRFKFLPTYKLNAELIYVSKSPKKPTQLALSNGQMIEIYQKSWDPFQELLPTYKINGITSSFKSDFTFFERFLVFMPLVIVIPGGMVGALISSIAIGLNLSLLHVNWASWQRTTAMLITTLVAAGIFLSGSLTFMHELKDFVKSKAETSHTQVENDAEAKFYATQSGRS